MAKKPKKSKRYVSDASKFGNRITNTKIRSAKTKGTRDDIPLAAPALGRKIAGKANV